MEWRGALRLALTTWNIRNSDKTLGKSFFIVKIITYWIGAQRRNFLPCRCSELNWRRLWAICSNKMCFQMTSRAFFQTTGLCNSVNPLRLCSWARATSVLVVSFPDGGLCQEVISKCWVTFKMAFLFPFSRPCHNGPTMYFSFLVTFVQFILLISALNFQVSSPTPFTEGSASQVPCVCYQHVFLSFNVFTFLSLPDFPVSSGEWCWNLVLQWCW